VAPVVAEPAPVEEDEWEWEIAMARARAAAEEVEQAAASVARPAVTKPMAAVAPPPAYENWDDSRTPRSVVKTVARATVKPIASPPAVRHASDTIIPVPKLPTVTDSRSLRPVGMVAVAPRRFPKATGPQSSDETVRTSPAPAPANDDRTRPGIALPPSNASTSRRVAARQR
jgi:hypothetical protein